MEVTKEITIVRTIAAPRSAVWRAWTDPKELAKWWGPRGVTNPTSQVDLTVGGEIYIVMRAGAALGPLEGQLWPMRGTFTELMPQEKIVFTNNAIGENDEPALEGTTTVTFTDEGTGTLLTVVADARGVTPQAAQMIEGMTQGWTESVDKLQEMLENPARKQFFVIYRVPVATMEEWRRTTSPEKMKEQGETLMRDMLEWTAAHADALVDHGTPLGKTKTVSSAGITDTKNDLNYCCIVEAESHDAAAAMFRDNPHLQIPNSTIDVMEIPHPGL